MELLIPGLILVALMAWASTKIKKRAADAFEAETVETDRYILQKPEGFLHVLGDSDHEFYAYSREFGEGTSSKIRRATIEIDVLRSANLAEIRNAIKGPADDVRIARKAVGCSRFRNEGECGTGDPVGSPRELEPSGERIRDPDNGQCQRLRRKGRRSDFSERPQSKISVFGKFDQRLRRPRDFSI